MTINGAARATMPEWAREQDAGHRIDPRSLDRRVRFTIGSKGFSLDERGATVTREDGIAVALRPNAFKGIAARAVEDADGKVTVTLELMHENAALSVPLLVANDLDHVAADWRDWSRMFTLPMLMVEADASISTLDEVRPAQPRRARPNLRPRFLMRRRIGAMGVAMKIEGCEIIARR